MLVTRPLPLKATDSRWRAGSKRAVAVRSASTVTVHAPVPLHAPLQPAKTAPVAAAGVSVTAVPWSTMATQLAGHTRPGALPVTEPEAAPASVTVSMCLAA